jgi:hypothetical protein
MNLLSVLLKIMLAEKALSALSGKTGLSSAALKKLLPLAIPLLLRYMTSNASSQSGALSLLGALTQHSLARNAEEMLREADEEDGGKIVKHILGDDDSKVVQSLSAETGMSEGEVTRGLNGMAPLLLSVLAASMLSANNQSSSNSGSIDLSNVLNMFGGSQQTSNASLLGSLLGGGSTAQSSASNSLLGALLGATPTTTVQQPVQQQQSTSLLNALLGGGSSAPVQQQSSSSLLGSLLGVTPVQTQTQAKPKPKPKPQQQVQQASSGSLLDALLGTSTQQVQPVQQTSSGGLLDALLGVTPTQQVQQQTVNNLNGNNLLSLLLGAMQ